MVAGRGFHEPWGGPHADTPALHAARVTAPDERFDTLVCPPEPGPRPGKTPACTGALLEAGIRRVVVGALDPNPRHRGKGLELLAQMGVEVELLSAATPIENVAPHFLRWIAVERVRRPRPWVLAKWAQTRTGQLSPPADVGDGRWITGAQALAEVAERRGRVDAILTGVGTVLADDPRLTVRPPGDRTHPPLRVVLDTELRTPPDARLFAPLPPDAEEAGGEVVILCRAGAPAKAHRALEAAGARIIGLRADSKDRVSLRATLETLWEAGVQRLLLEAGPTLLNAFFDAGFVDQVAVYSGPVNGGRGLSLAARLNARDMLQPGRRELGDDTVLEAFVR
jgi:diaminohydroxyphosphoribosylaminopyrimidine deaminase/5-amino-6-(5-phosphoribosylamino)uracil reductase